MRYARLPIRHIARGASRKDSPHRMPSVLSGLLLQRIGSARALCDRLEPHRTRTRALVGPHCAHVSFSKSGPDAPRVPARRRFRFPFPSISRPWERFVTNFSAPLGSARLATANRFSFPSISLPSERFVTNFPLGPVRNREPFPSVASMSLTAELFRYVKIISRLTAELQRPRA